VTVGGLHFSALKYCSHEQENPQACGKIASSCLLLVAILSFITCAALYALAVPLGQMLNSPGVTVGLSFAIPGLFFFSLNKVLIMVLNGLRRMRAFAVFQALRYMLILAAVTGIIVSGQPNPHLPLSFTIAEMFLTVALLVYVNLFLFRIKLFQLIEMRPWFRRHISFGSRGFLSGVLIEMNTRVDVLMVGIFMPDTTVGVYSFASTFAEGFGQLTTVIRQNLAPIVGKCFAEGNEQRIQKVAGQVRRVFWPLMVIGGGGLVLVFPIVLQLLHAGGQMRHSWGILTILVAAYAFTSAHRAFLCLFPQGGRPGTLTLVIGGAVSINIVLNACLIPLLGIYGAAVATAAACALQAGAIAVLARRLFGIRL